MTPTLEPLWCKATRQVGYKLRNGSSRALFFKKDELAELRSLLAAVLEDSNAALRT
ncbi:Uncharacterised protein [Mycobacteroides abscessus subsp. bolletii]|nr:Uncharacterised protein [Mycobacteroides abscessus subsp. bolletii]SHS10585.1 Uncharacterised protein [Mycobacteroides abscessus subsp. bolletii]SHS80552.1 Uncharacterised protein [Mycobacteroides abscessus subsp. bolletii]SHS84287.1 Uncharacterised protein [Mycobacteroides abscessus subsp. bolletii]SHX73753.1 Uncharacterised protein [Mycobacteroides abscessus subsp. bolletii]